MDKISNFRYKAMIVNLILYFFEENKDTGATDEEIWDQLKDYLGASDSEIAKFKTFVD